MSDKLVFGLGFGIRSALVGHRILGTSEPFFVLVSSRSSTQTLPKPFPNPRCGRLFRCFAVYSRRVQSVAKCAGDFQLFYSSNADLKKGNVDNNSTKTSKL